MIEDILSRLTNVQPRGRGYTADCPLHPSKPAVLRVTREFGQVLLECPDSCPDHEIAAALGLTLVDLMEDDDSPGEAEAVNHPAPPEKAPVDLEHPRWNAFDLKPAGQWLAESSIRPVPRQLFGEFWLEDELSILFADTGKGKSILAVQIAESLARGLPIAPFHLNVPGQKVLYFDFELSDKMFESRYSCATGRFVTDLYPFSPKFFRAQFDPVDDYTGYYDTWGEYLHASFDELITETKATALIIDNITFLGGTRSTERTAPAMRVMQVLKEFKKDYSLSILVLAHTPKRRYGSGLTVNDLQGSKMLSNFADNIFAIGESCLGPNVRYLKHIKPRNTVMTHGANNVCVYRIEKESNFLQFRFIGYSTEREHLENISLNYDIERQVISKKIRDLAASGSTQREIAEHLGLSLTTVNRYLKKGS